MQCCSVITPGHCLLVSSGLNALVLELTAGGDILSALKHMPEPVPQRPVSITLLAAFFLLYGLVTLYPKVLLLTNSEVYAATIELTEAMSAGGFVDVPVQLQIVLGFLGSLLTIVGSIFFWRGSNLARWAIAIWISAMIALHFLQTGVSLFGFMQIPLYLLVLYLLFRPGADRFFRGA